MFCKGKPGRVSPLNAAFCYQSWKVKKLAHLAPGFSPRDGALLPFISMPHQSEIVKGTRRGF
jgi:hypothetical protein